MPIYHFNLTAHARDEDEEGTDLPGLQTARIQGLVYAGDYLHDPTKIVWDGRSFAVEVTNNAGRALFAIPIGGREAA